MAENNFQSTVEALFKGMDSFITTKSCSGRRDYSGRYDYLTAGGRIFWRGSRSFF